MSPNYSTYVTYSIDSNHNIFSAAVVDGSTTGEIPFPTVKHQGRVYNKLGSANGWVYGPMQPAASYISITNTQEIINAQPGVNYPNSMEGDINCSIAGLFFSSSHTGTGLFYHTTYGANTNGSQVIANTRFCGMTPACTPPTRATCGNPSYTVAVYPSSNPCYPYDEVPWVYLEAAEKSR
jgi:hypothetical protein